MSELTEKFLDEIYEFKSGLSKPREEFGFGHGFVSFKDIFYNYFIPETLTELVNTSDQEQESCSVKRGDVFLTRTSETFNELGMSSVALKDYPKATFNGFTKRLRPKSTDEIWPEYIGYYFRSASFRNIVSSMATMTTRASLNNEILSRLKVKYPPLPEQKAIAHILGTLDEKIELNRKMNQTLEAMAQALFKSWFVDFDPVIDNAIQAGNEIPEELQARAEKRKGLSDSKKLLSTNLSLAAQFPASFVFNETLGKWIPEGWEVKTADRIASITIGKTPPRKEQHWFETSKNDLNYTWVSIKNMGNSGMFISDSDEYLTRESVEKFNVVKVKADTVILSFKMTVGRVAITTKEMCTNEAIAHFSNPKEGLFSGYIYQYLKGFDFETLGSTSSIATAVNSKLIKQIPFLVPSRNVLNQFKDSVKGLNQRILNTQNEIETLIQLRDRLLPELISGRVRVKE